MGGSGRSCAASDSLNDGHDFPARLVAPLVVRTQASLTGLRRSLTVLTGFALTGPGTSLTVLGFADVRAASRTVAAGFAGPGCPLR